MAFYAAKENKWKEEYEEHEKVSQGIDVLSQIDKIMDRAFDLLSADRYGEMGTYHYTSMENSIQKCREKNENVMKYADTIFDILESKENTFHKQFSRAMESLSKLDIESYEVDNTLNIEEWHTVQVPSYTGSNAYSAPTQMQTTSYKTKKGKITLSDIQAKTDMFGLQEQYANYLKEIGRDESKLTPAEVDKLKKEFYKQALNTAFDHKVYNDGWFEALSTTIDYIPLVGGVKSFIEGLTGQTMTGEQLSANEKVQYMVMGAISSTVDVFAFGAATAAIQGSKTVVKVGTTLGKIAIKDVGTGWALNLGSQALAKVDLPPELAFAAHIGLNLVISKHNTIKRIDNLATEMGLEADQVKDLMKYTGKNLDAFENAVKNGGLDELLELSDMNMSYLIKQTGKSADEINEILKNKKIDLKDINSSNIDDIIKEASGVKMPEITSKFNYKSKYDEVEFTTQLKNQEKGLNDLTISEFVENRKNFNELGRSKEATKLQKELREMFQQDKIDELFENGLSYEDAVNEADRWIKSQAVLHDPDQIAGGNPMNLTGLGDKNINSSIGSQWRYRIDDLEKQIMDFANTIPKSEWGNVKLNIKLTY